MSATLVYLLNNPFILDVSIILLLMFFMAFYYITKSIQPSEDFDSKMLRYITHKEKKDSLLYCINFFKEAYDSGRLPVLNDFMAFRLMAAVVFTFYKKTNDAAYVFLKLRSYYFKKRKLPDFTEKYREWLIKDGREGDIVGAFCIHGHEEFSKLKEDETPLVKNVTQ